MTIDAEGAPLPQAPAAAKAPPEGLRRFAAEFAESTTAMIGLVLCIVIVLAAIFAHSNLRLPTRLERALGWVVITPAIHWVHHHAVRRDTDSNYGNLFSFWDRIFGSFSPNRREPDMKIGVEREPEKPFLRLFVRPFEARQN